MTESTECSKQALQWFEQGFNCAQAVLLAFDERVGIERELAMKIALGLGGGLGRCGEVCGAVNGACMVLGMDSGDTADPYSKENRAAAYGRVKEFIRTFRARCGAVTCRDLIGYDISTDEGRAAAVEDGVFKRLCPGFVENAALIVESMLDAGPAGSDSR